MLKLLPATESDATPLCELARRTFFDAFARENRPEDMALYASHAFGEEKQLAEIRDPNRRTVIAWEEGQAIGFYQLRIGAPDPAVRTPQPVELLRLYVDTQWHGKAVGAALMNSAIEAARKEGFQSLWLGVWERNFRAQAFYRKFSFVPVGSHEFMLGNDRQMDLVFVRVLSGL